MSVCVNQTTGAVTARPKCKTGESPLNAKALATSLAVTGPQGPQGAKGDPGIINTSSCYEKQGQYQLSDPRWATAYAECNDPNTEFMLSDSMDYQPSVDLLISERRVVLHETQSVPTGIILTTYGLNMTPQYQLRALIICCKR